MEMARAPKQRPLTRLVGENLAHWRKQRGLSLAELSARMDDVGLPLNLNGLNKIERGNRGVDLDELVALARALGVPPLQLIFPIGREQMTEVLPGTAIPTWTAAKWFTGEESFPAALRDGGWGASTEDLNALKAGVPLLFRKLDELYARWADARRDARDAREAAAEAETAKEREVRIRTLELQEELLRRAEDDVRRHREHIRMKGLEPGELFPEFAYLDEAPDGQR